LIAITDSGQRVELDRYRVAHAALVEPNRLRVVQTAPAQTSPAALAASCVIGHHGIFIVGLEFADSANRRWRCAVFSDAGTVRSKVARVTITTDADYQLEFDLG